MVLNPPRPPANHIERALRNAIDKIARLSPEDEPTVKEDFMTALLVLQRVYSNGQPRSLTLRREFANALRAIVKAADEAALDPDQRRMTTLEMRAYRP